MRGYRNRGMFVGAVLLIVALVAGVWTVRSGTPDNPPSMGESRPVSSGDLPGSTAGLPFDASTSPLIDFLGGRFESANSQLSEQQILIAQCMSDRGWQFAPEDPAADVVDEKPLQLGALVEWTKTYGYGVTIYAEPVGTARSTGEQNRLYYESLSSAQKDAYVTDLNGPPVERDPEYVPTESSTACEHEAFLALAEGTPIDDAAVVALSARESRALRSDPRFVSAELGWSRCMAARGYNYRRHYEPNAFINDQSFETDREADPEDWLSLQHFERDVAIADLECSIDTILPVKVEIEMRIVQEIVDRFPRYADIVDSRDEQ